MRRVLKLALAAALVAVACRGDNAVLPTPAPTSIQAGGTLRVAVPAEITTLDPWNADAASILATRQIYETLVVIDPTTGLAAPGLATTWQMSNDGASWTFALRHGITLHDGTPFDAVAVVASFERGRGTPAYAGLFDRQPAISSVVAIDASTVRFELRAPYGPFLAHLAAPATAIAHGTAGTGAFVAAQDALAPDGTLTLRRNETYWRTAQAGRSLPYLDGLVLRPVRDAATRLAELRGGRADLAVDLPVPQAVTARSDPNLMLVVRPNASLTSLGVDVTKAPFDRAEVRRAIAMSIDRTALNNMYFGLSRTASQVVPPAMLGYDESVVEFSPLDVNGAKRVLVDTRVVTPISADLAYPSLATAAYPDPQRVAQSVAADLTKLGIVARLRAVDPAAMATSGATFALETTAIGLDPDDVFSPLFAAGEGSTSLVPGLLAKARAESDASKRSELYKQVSKIGRAEVPRVPLLFVDRASAASARVTGFTADPNASFGTLWLRP